MTNSTEFYFRFNQSTSLAHFAILGRSLLDHDLCRLANVPSRIPVKLARDNPCSCTVHYLYRDLHRALFPLAIEQFAPSCYSNMSLDQIEQAQLRCSLEKRIFHCQQMEGHIQINIPQGLCLSLPPSHPTHPPHQRRTYLVFICAILAFVSIYACLYKSRRSIWKIISKYALPSPTQTPPSPPVDQVQCYPESKASDGLISDRIDDHDESRLTTNPVSVTLL